MKAQTWNDVWAFITIVSLLEIPIVRVTAATAQIPCRSTDVSCPDPPEMVGPDEMLHLESIG